MAEAVNDLQLTTATTPLMTTATTPLVTTASTPPVTTATNIGQPGRFFQLSRPKLRVTSEYDSDSSVFLHKVSCKLLDNLAKLKLSFQNNSKGEVSDPQVSFTSTYFSLMYDVEENDALVKAQFDIAPGFGFRAAHQVKARQGEIAMVADLAGPAYKLELSSAVPSVGTPKATFKFPLGELSLEEKEEDEEEQRKFLSVNGLVKSHILNGLCTARYSEENLELKYAFKDEQLTFIPSISLPSNAVSCAFKRRFRPSDKMSYYYHFDSNNWSTVYKHTAGKDYKFKAGYDSEVRLGWASLWVGDEDGKAKIAPMKMKVQFMLQVPQSDLKSSVLMFRVKKSVRTLRCAAREPKREGQRRPKLHSCGRTSFCQLHSNCITTSIRRGYNNSSFCCDDD